MSVSPSKPSAAPATRASLTANLKKYGPANELSVNDFSRACFRNVLTPEVCANYIPDRASSLVKAIRGCSSETEAYEKACNLFNKICDKYARLNGVSENDQLAFVVHAFHPLVHHPDSYTAQIALQKPDLVVTGKRLARHYNADVRKWCKAKDSDKKGVLKPALALPLARSFVEGKGASDPNAHFQAATYLGSLLQARPDLVGCFGLAMSSSCYRLLWCDVSGVYYTETISWNDGLALPMLVQYIRELHAPLLDHTIWLDALDTTSDDCDFDVWTDKSYASRPVWIVRDKEHTEYVAEKILSVGPAWSRKNWVVRAACTRDRSGALQPLDPPVIIKDSFILSDRANVSTEGDILKHIHQNGPVPGVVTMFSDFHPTHDAEATQPIRNVELPPDMDDTLRFPTRVRYRLFLPAYEVRYIHDACPSVKDFLMVLYDVLEVLKNVHGEHDVTHRDIGPFNILVGPAPTADVADTLEWPSIHKGPVFIRRLLSFKDLTPAPNIPTCRLIDFDNAFQTGKDTRAVRTAKPGFVARAISAGAFTRAVAIPPIPPLSGTAQDAYIRVFGRARYELASAFHDLIAVGGRRPNNGVIPHKPRHDVESCYWVAVWVLILALPEGALTADDNTHDMSGFFADFESHRVRQSRTQDLRTRCLTYDADQWESILHRGLASLAPFMVRLSGLIEPEYGVVTSDLDPHHLHEGMQRLILEEICRLDAEGNPLRINMQETRTIIPPDEADKGLAATAPLLHASRSAKESVASGESRQNSGKRSRVASLRVSSKSSSTHPAGSSSTPSGPDSTPSGPSSTPADDKAKRRRITKDETAPTRSSERQRVQRASSTNARSQG